MLGDKTLKADTDYTVAYGNNKKVLSVNKNTGKITVKKGTKPGTYKLQVVVTAAKTDNTYAVSKTVTVKVKVKR